MAHDECRTFYSSRGECTPAALNAWGAEMVVVNHLKALVQLLWNPFRQPKGRVIFVVHGIHLRKYDWRMKEGGVRGACALPLYWLRRGLEAWLYRRCDQIVALTETDRADILRLYGRGLRVEVEPNTLEGWEADNVYSGVSDIRMTAEGRSLFAGEGTRSITHEMGAHAVGLEARRQDECSGTFQYICIGRFDYPKGQDRWVRKCLDFRAFSPAPRTLFIGDGPMLEHCKTLARRLGVADLCVFAGAIPDADRYLKCASVVVSPSRWEGMPYLMLKARALGCRILATDCPGNRDALAGYEKWEKLEL